MTFVANPHESAPLLAFLFQDALPASLGNLADGSGKLLSGLGPQLASIRDTFEAAVDKAGYGLTPASATPAEAAPTALEGEILPPLAPNTEALALAAPMSSDVSSNLRPPALSCASVSVADLGTNLPTPCFAANYGHFLEQQRGNTAMYFA
ncbi:MAG: hypothetical protein K2Q12_01770 [Rickettsiales bacterium]|nr:hypothetical protein [Rickettsiales bacterium]